MTLDQIEATWKSEQMDIEAETSAWDSTADDYVYEDKINFTDDPFLRFMSEKTDLNSQMRTLDVGCGAGAYSVALAERVGQADGVDLSPRMVALGNEYASLHGVDNMKLWVENWHSCDTVKFRGRYDVVFAHTTPAVADFATLRKLCDASRGSCFLCKPARRTDLVFDQLRTIAGIKSADTAEDPTVLTFAALWYMGYDPESAFTKVRWVSERSVEDAEKWYLGRLRGSAKITDAAVNEIRSFLRDIASDGIVREQTDTTLVHMYWRVSD